ncbi:hypothetical protein ACVJBD_005331 [Rhizobium mongolense]
MLSLRATIACSIVSVQGREGRGGNGRKREKRQDRPSHARRWRQGWLRLGECVVEPGEGLAAVLEGLGRLKKTTVASRGAALPSDEAERPQEPHLVPEGADPYRIVAFVPGPKIKHSQSCQRAERRACGWYTNSRSNGKTGRVRRWLARLSISWFTTPSVSAMRFGLAIGASSGER